MAYNFINADSSVRLSNECVFDSNDAYVSDFNENGNVDYWDQYVGIHTYGVWGGFLFGTFYTTYSYIGRNNVFLPAPAESHYVIKITMKLNPVNYTDNEYIPVKGLVRWRTLTDVTWDSYKEVEFDVIADNKWHAYHINMGENYYWQGDINDLRIYPATDAVDGNEFFIRSIKISSYDTFQCNNPGCSFYSQYSHPCQGVGTRTSCLSSSKVVDGYVVSPESELILNINSYGNEKVDIPAKNYTGTGLANAIASEASKVSIGGYSEIVVSYTSDSRFLIENGIKGEDSTIVIGYNSFSEQLGFFDSFGTSVYEYSLGEFPATEYYPKSSFNVSTFQLLGLFDNKSNTSFEFDPSLYSVQGGRFNWLESGFGQADISASTDVAGEERYGVATRDYGKFFNVQTTLIDFTHPFNASGRIEKIYVLGTYDSGETYPAGAPIYLTGAKVFIFRPDKYGHLRRIASVDIPDRDTGGSKLYSTTIEAVVIDCDILVNKGDLIGVYNFSLYVGPTLGDSDADAMYFRVDGAPEQEVSFDPGKMYGNGNAGLLVYARSSTIQNNLTFDVDFNRRINIKNVIVEGTPKKSFLEYNIARCLDLNWEVDLLGSVHEAGYFETWDPIAPYWVVYQIPSVAYGIDNLDDGITIVTEAEAAPSYSVTDAGGMVPYNPRYFHVNGDGEWVGVHHLVGPTRDDQYVKDFRHDPMAITMYFPREKEKTIYKSVMYFKEKFNFRSIGLSYYLGEYDSSGNADTPFFRFIPSYTNIILDGIEYKEGTPNYENVNEYLFQNPSYGTADLEIVGNVGTILNYEAWSQMQYIDWLTITHEFDPLICKGFRIFSDYHESTKINEIELYCYVSDAEASLAAAIDISYSHYNDLWWPVSVYDINNTQATGEIDDTPRYLNVQIEPITPMELSNVVFSVTSENVYTGKKGCKYEVLPVEAKIGATNAADILYFKNDYGRDFNLYVDIAKDPDKKESVVFFSTLESADSIHEPEIGPGAYFVKNDDYPLVHQNNNCAINCPVYGLRNLIDNKLAYVSYDGGDRWEVLGRLSSGVSLDILNIVVGNKTTLYPDVIYRERYWRLYSKWDALSIDINELRFYDEYDNELVPLQMYHDVGSGPAVNVAPHLNNGSLPGSYYTLTPDDPLTFDFGLSVSPHKIIFWHQDTPVYTNVVDQAGIDIYTALCINGWSVDDHSYFEHPPTNNGVVVSSDMPGISSETLYFNGDSTITFPGHEQWVFTFASFPEYAFETRFNLDSLPNDDEEFVIAENGLDGATNSRWRYVIRGESGNVYISLYVNNSIYPTGSYMDYHWTAPDTGVWHHMSYVANIASWFYLYLDGALVSQVSTGGPGTFGAIEPVTVGRNFKGYLEEIRVSHIDRSGTPPTKFFERFPSLSVYTSINNIVYGKHSDLDMSKTPSIFAVNYNTYLAIDLEKRHDLDFVRSYGNNSPTAFDLLNNICYSKEETISVDVAFDNTTCSPNVTAATASDVRWVFLTMLNGDGVDRAIRKIGVYPKIQTIFAPSGAQNNYWDSLGPSLTTYLSEQNTALYTTGSGSSYFQGMDPSYVTDGYEEGGFYKVWGSHEDDSPWLDINLGSEKDIYKIELYFGLTESDASYMVRNYTLQVSTDGGVYTTIATVIDNIDNYRLHQLTIPVAAKYVKINISDYTATQVQLGVDGGYAIFNGAVIREIKVYEYSGYSVVSSEDYPVVCTNLEYQFYLREVSLVGINPNDTSTDWDSSSFTYSDFFGAAPERVNFKEWGQTFNFEKWIAIKQDTATSHNDGPDYLKYILAEATTETKPCDHASWWGSSISTLSKNNIFVRGFSNSSIKIEYPASDQFEHIFYYEGDDFGIDTLSAYRDGLGFYLYIDDINNFDLTDGYFYFGGYDYTAAANPVYFTWNISDPTISGILTSGWNGLFLRFSQANTITSTDLVFPDVSPNKFIESIESPNNITLRTIGLKFKGKGGPITLYLNGFAIVRNKFDDTVAFGKRGLYLSQNDLVSFNLGELDMTRGTVEFYLYPDFDYKGFDAYGEFRNRALFHMTNTTNEVFGAVVTTEGLYVYHGNVDKDFYALIITQTESIKIDNVIHLAFVYSSTGEHIDSDLSTIRVYFNGQLITKSRNKWTISDNKYIKFMLGGKAVMAPKDDSFTADTYSMSAVVSNLKIYNYCKTDFTDSLTNELKDQEKSLIGPSNYIELSKDNLTFYKVGDFNLPLFFEMVPAGDLVPVYVRTSLPEGLTSKEQRSAAVVGEWDISI